MAKYNKFEISINQAKKLFAKQLDDANIKINSKKTLLDSFNNFNTNYIKKERELRNKNLDEDTIKKEIDKTKLLFELTNGKYLYNNQFFPLLKIGNYKDTGIFEDGFSSLLYLIENSDSDFYSFYTKESKDEIKKIFGNKAYQETVEIDENFIERNIIKEEINWNTMKEQQNAVEVSSDSSWGLNEIDKKRQLLLKNIAESSLTPEDFDYLDNLKKTDIEYYTDILYESLFNEDKNKNLSLKNQQHIFNYVIKLSESYPSKALNYYLNRGESDKLEQFSLDSIELSLKFLLKKYEEYKNKTLTSKENSANDVSNNEDMPISKINEYLMAYMKILTIAPEFQSLKEFVIAENELSLLEVVNPFEFKIAMYKNTNIPSYLKVYDEVVESKTNNKGENYNIIKFRIDNIILNERATLLQYKEKLFDIAKDIKSKEMKKGELRVGKTKKEKLNILDYKEFFVKPEEIASDLLIFLTKYDNNEYNNLYSSLFVRVCKKIKNDVKLKEDVKNLVYFYLLLNNDDNGWGVQKSLFNINVLDNFLSSEMNDIDILKFLKYQYVNEYISYNERNQKFLDIIQKNDHRYEIGKKLFIKYIENEPNDNFFLLKTVKIKNKLIKDVGFENSESIEKMRELLSISLSVYENLINNFKYADNEDRNAKEIELHKRNELRDILYSNIFYYLNTYNDKKRKVAEELVLDFLNTEGKERERNIKIWKYILKKEYTRVTLNWILSREAPSELSSPIKGDLHQIGLGANWGESKIKKSKWDNKDLLKLCVLLQQMENPTYSIIMTDEIKANLLCSAIMMATTNADITQEKFEDFKNILHKHIEENDYVKQEVLNICKNIHVFEKKRAKECLKQLGILDMVQNHVLEEENYIEALKYLPQELIDNFYKNSKNDKKMWQLKFDNIGVGKDIDNATVNINILSVLIKGGYVTKEEYLKAFEIHILSNDIRNFPVYKLDNFKRSSINEKVDVVNRVIGRLSSIRQALSIASGFSSQFHSDLYEEDIFIEGIASILRSIQNRFETVNIYQDYKEDIRQIYRTFGENKFKILNAMLDISDNSLDNCLSKIKLANIMKEDKQKVVRKKI